MAATISQFLQNLVGYQYQPALIQKDIFDHLSQVTSGAVDLVDASNPFVFNMEAACVMLAGFMSKDQVRTRLQYPMMAQTPTDLYPHMSDWDYIGRFAAPSHTTLGFALVKDEVINKMVTDPTTGIKKLVIPRNSFVTVASVVFSLQYPVEIRQMLHGGIQAVYDATQSSPLQTLSTNVIPLETRTVGGVDMLYFELDLYQMTVSSMTGSITQAQAFSLTYTLKDSYYYTRVWSQNDDLTWTEIKTTMTPEVFDVTTPTAVIVVGDGQITVKVPAIYTTSGALKSKIRCDFYETKGALSMDMGAYPSNAFTATWNAIDKNDQTIFTAPMNTLQTVVIMGNSLTLDGAAALDFATLRERVINNATGPINLPITNAQLEAKLTRMGYGIVKNVDNITNRVFLATKAMPTPTNAKLITAANASIETVTTSMASLSTLATTIDNGASITLTPDTIYKNVKGVVQVCNPSEITALNQLPPTQRALAINQQNYYYSPWHYVLDASGVEFDLRAYYLDGPAVITTVFISENDTTLLQVGTKSYTMVRTATGYQLQVLCNSGTDWKALPDDQCYVQLGFVPIGEQDMAYVNGVLAGTDPVTGERMFTFDLSSTLNIDSNDDIELTKFTLYTTDARVVKADLTTQFDLLWCTTAVMDTQWQKGTVDSKLGRWLLPSNIVGITNEQIRVKFGDALNTLWSRSRTVVGDIPYKTYATDVPALYVTDVYQQDANGSYITFDAQGNPVMTKLHSIGEPILDSSGNPVYLHRAGDVVTDGNGIPEVGGNRDLIHQLDLMMLEGAYYFANDSAAVGYRGELIETVLAWLLNDLQPLNDQALEQTKIYFYPQATMGYINVIDPNGLKTQILAGQTLTQTLYVSKDVNANDDLKTQLETACIKTLAAGLNVITVSQSDLQDQLHTVYGSDVYEHTLTGLGGTDMPLFSVVDTSTRAGLRKIVTAQGDDSLIVTEAVSVLFVEYTTTAS